MAEKGLASRFKAAISKEEQQSQDTSAADAERQARAARFLAAEAQLFDDLTVLANDIGGIDATRGDAMLTLNRSSHRLSLHRDRVHQRLDVRFDGEPVGTGLILADETWYLESGLRSVVLFDEGLEELLVQGLGLPAPEKDANEAPKAPAVAEPEAEASPAPAEPAAPKPGEQVILRDVKLDKPAVAGASSSPKSHVVVREANLGQPTETKQDRTYGPPGSQVRDLPKW